MKFLAIASLFASAFQMGSSVMPVFECGEGKVPCHNMGICIEPNYIEGCSSYLNQNECAQCSEKYELSEGYCNYYGNDAQDHIPGCLTIDRLGKCRNCAIGFKRINGKCEKGIKNCAHFSKNKCSECKANYSLIFGECRHNLLLGCKNQENGHFCRQCFKPFSLNGKHCDIPHCQKLNDFGCVTCECGYFLTQERDCKEVTQGCLRYSKGRCINCLTHYRLKGGVCEIEGCEQYSGFECIKCDQKFEMTEDGGCKFKNCYDWSDQNCLVCENGYSKKHGICQEIPEQYKECHE